MSKIYSYVLASLFLLTLSFKSYTQVPEMFFQLPASGYADLDQAGGFLSTVDLATPLLPSDKWVVHAETTYKGVPSNSYYGTRLFQAVVTWDDSSPDTNGNHTDLLNFYLRCPVGYPGAYTGNIGRLLERNAAFTPVLGVDTDNGTLFSFDIISDGTGAIRAYVTVNDTVYQKVYDQHQILQINQLAAGSNYDVSGYIVAASDDNPLIFPAANLNFNEVLSGEKATSTFKAGGIGLTGNITATIGGDDAAAFSVSPASVTNGGIFTVTFSPTERKVYNATITLSATGATPVVFNVSGNSDFDLPVLISSADNSSEHWYYLQFTRRTSANLVWSLNDSTRMVVQDTLKAGIVRLDQQWKICGDWGTGYYIVNRATAQEVIYNTKSVVGDDGETRIYTDVPSADRYIAADAFGDNLGFAHFNNGATWQLYNQTISKYNTPAQNYLNDLTGMYIDNYSANDAGNELKFISADAGNIVTTVSSLSMVSPVGENASSDLSVIGTSLTDDITAAITNDEASVFSVTPATLPAEGGTFTIAFAPAAVKNNQTATLTLTSGSAQTVIALIGNSDIGLPLFSSADDSSEHWYYMQFNRKATGGTATQGVVIQGNGMDQILSQADTLATGQSDNYAQQWKFAGTYANGFYIINRAGGQMSFSPDDGFYTLADIGDLHTFDGYNSTYQWQILNTEKDDDPDGGANLINDYGGLSQRQVGMYYVNDAGNYLRFISVDGTGGTAIQNPAIDLNDNTVISTTYYTLEGVQVKQPTGTGIYIVKKLYASGKMQATKILFHNK